MSCFAHCAPLRSVVAAATLLAPLAGVRAEPSATDWLTPQSVGAVTVRLADAAKAPLLAELPIEVLAAATEDFLGVRLDSIDRVTLVVDPPVGANPQYAVVLASSEGISFDRFRSELKQQLSPGEIEGRPALVAPAGDPTSPSLCLLDDHTLAAGPRPFLKRLARRAEAPHSDLAAAMTRGDAPRNHLHAAVTLPPLRPLLDLGLAAAKQSNQLSPAAVPYLDALRLVDRLEVTADLSGARPSSITAFAADKSAAAELERLVAAGNRATHDQIAADPNIAALRTSEEAVVRAYAAYIDRMNEHPTVDLAPLREGDNAYVFGRVTLSEQNAKVGLGVTAVVGVLVALLLPAVQAAREAARRNVSINHTKQLGLALHIHHDAHRSFPAQAIRSADGKPLLSWRVAILPFIEEQALYERFHLDEPWDSPHNKALLPLMPEVFLDPSSPGLQGADGKTHYLGVAGPHAAFPDAAKGRQLRHFQDGLSQSLAVVQVDDDHAVEWTRPADFDAEANTDNPAAAIGTLHPGTFIAGFADGSVRTIAIDTDPATLRALFTIDGGEVVELP